MADTYDLLTLAEGKTACNITGTGHDVELAQFITAVSRRVDELCGYVVKRTVTAELHDGGRTFIRPRHTPILDGTTSTAVSEYIGTTETELSEESNATKPASGFLVVVESVHNVKVYRRAGNTDASFPSGRRNISITYESGRAAATASVDAKFKRAAGNLLQRLWNRDAAVWSRGGDPFDPGTVQHSPLFLAMSAKAIRDLLGDEMKAAVVA